MKNILSFAAIVAVIIGVLNDETSIKAVDAQACGRLRPRREFRMLSQQERTNFINAIRQLQSGPAPTRYDQYVSTHWNARENTHGYAQFFPWHRYFLREFEKELQRINSSIMIPYWDWTFDSQSPELSPIFSDSFMGGNGWGGCVRSGPFANWFPSFPTRKCLSRVFDRDGRLSAFASPEQIMAIMRTADTYHDMRIWTETPPHGIIHSSIGGDMETMYSPNDPIFWLHHAFIDKLWDNWQRLGNNRNFWLYDDINNDGSASMLVDPLWPFNVQVRDVMDSQRFCYYYEPFLPNRAPMAFNTDTANVSWDMTMRDSAALDWQHTTEMLFAVNTTTTTTNKAITPMLTVPDDDRSELVAIRASKPLPESWLKMNHYNVTQVRIMEEKLRRVVDRVNRLNHYVSPAALARHDNALSAIAHRLTKSPVLVGALTATVGGKLKHIMTELPQQATVASDSVQQNLPDQHRSNNHRHKDTGHSSRALSPSNIISIIRERVEAITGTELSSGLVPITDELQTAARLDGRKQH